MTGEEQATILVVEDERELADTYARWLADTYDVRVAYTGREALESLDDSIDAVLLDRRLPDIPGRDVLGELRERGYDCRVAMITAVDPDFDIVDMEFEDYIVKPVLKSDLHDIVERLLKLSTFDQQSQQSFAVASKIEVLEDEKTHVELGESEEYGSLKQELSKLQEGIDDILSEFDHRDFAAVYRELDADVSEDEGGEST